MAASIGRFVLKYSPAIYDAVFLIKHQTCPSYNLTQVMYMRSQHYDPKFRTRRREKMLYIDRDQFSEKLEDLPVLEKRKKKRARDKDSQPDRLAQRRKPSFLESPQTIDPYVPPEGDGKHSILGVEGVKDLGKKMLKKAQARAQAIRTIRKYGEENFNAKDVAPELLEIYIEAHDLLMDVKKNENRLHDLCTLNAFNLMTHNMDRMTFRWEFVESLHPPKVVHVVCKEVTVKDVYFAQVTVRIHSKQKLAMYDQFGRLMYGSPLLEKDVLDFVVFEKNIVDLYGKWRIHDKIVPEWLPLVYKNQSLRLSSDEVEEVKEAGAVEEAKS
ncbi:probable 39S ribosomal protein L45, mitochondrial [Mercenaria mercenaria]|uniref:probable 39S ribosomal protein L45, mitochondrial n=1 Tax=Mercenaria mercenaria TaxID=6596 RepID=UPI00234F54C1|nr:probable 39S ribosomal protein L45, mitochondrial [Mercenaria mercenaria]